MQFIESLVTRNYKKKYVFFLFYRGAGGSGFLSVLISKNAELFNC